MPDPLRFILLHADDNVAVSPVVAPAGAVVRAGGHTLTLAAEIPAMHKAALVDIPSGDPIRKFGQIIGFAAGHIAAGAWVHSHNVTAEDFERRHAVAVEPPPAPPPLAGRTFQGILRDDGRVATRNYVAVISNVNCSASVSKWIARRFDAAALAPYPNIDGVAAFTHTGGCAMQFGGENHKMLNRVLGGFARHANVAAYLLVGLGCETATLGNLIESQSLVQLGPAPQPPPMISMQDCGGTAAAVEEGVRQIAAMLPAANDVRRTPVDASRILLATECGGSDGASGVTANPALGVATDRVVAAGGTSIISELSEIYGAEHLLAARAVSQEVGEALLERIRWWEWYTSVFGARLDNNPSPGNKAGGLTTIYEKSLGAVSKGGSTALRAVYQYAETVSSRGLVAMDTPGFDPASVTGMVAGGANVVAFTTGRGSCFGCKPVPSIKIATNTPMYERMEADMDLNAGVIADGSASVEEFGEVIFDKILAVAGGERTKSELAGVGDEEFAPWNIGPIL